MSGPPSQGDWLGPPELPAPPPDEQLPPPLTPEALKPARENYEPWTREPLVYLPVVLGGVQIGCLWASTRHKAAGFLYLPGAVGRQEYDAASTIWWERLADAYEQGLSATDAVLRWRGAPDPRAGGIPADARERELPSLASLYELVEPGVPAPEGPFIQDGKFPDGTPVDRSQGWGPLISAPQPPTYATTSDGPIRYVPVVRDGVVVGYLWASLDGDAADFEPRKAAGVKGEIAAALWKTWLSDIYAEGVSGLEALGRCKASLGHPLSGVVGSDAEERELPNVRALRELAQR
ncbi:MAG: hypothetical protein IRY90_22210 [Actinomadura rubrobrunea]|nr:hypothetical protein [Actinomadura rubrobrunea]